MRKTLSVVVALLFAALSLHAAVQSVSLRHYTTENGLPSNCVRTVLQDSRGFMWFGTDGGLVRFDGKRCRHYSVNAADSATMDDIVVLSLHEHRGKLWIGLDHSLMYLDLATERIIVPRIKYAKSCKGQINAMVRHITSDRDGNVWVAVSGNGVFRIDMSTMVADQFECRQIDNAPGAVFIDSRGDIWTFGNKGQGVLMRFDRRQNRFVPFSLYCNGTKINAHALAMEEDASHTMWIGLWDGSVARFDPFTGHADIVARPSAQNGLYHIHSMETWTDGTFLIGSDGGLTVLDSADGSATLLHETASEHSSMSERFIYPLVRDHEHGMWIGSFYGGVSYMAPRLKLFETGRHSQFVNSVCGNVISAFCEDTAGNVWIATDDGGVCCRNASDGSFKKLQLPPEVNNIHALCFDGSDLWIGTYSQGILVYNTATGAIRRYTASDGKSALTDNSSYAIFRDRNANIWVATMNSINLFDRKSNSFKTARSIGAMCADIKQDAHGNIWFATQGKGLLRYNPNSGKWTDFRYSPRRGAIPHDHVNCIDIGANNNILIATDGGPAKYAASANRFEPMNIPLPNQVVRGIVEYQDAVWLTTAAGLVRHVKGGVTTVFTSDDGIADNQFTNNSVLLTSRGKLYLGSVGGYTAFYPHDIRSNCNKPQLAFTGMDIINSPVSVGDRQLPGSLNGTDGVTLMPDDYIVSFSFASLSYANPLKNQLIYKLEGFDNQWINAGPDCKATYTNLPPGSYTLRVRGSNDDNVWNEEGIALSVKVLPPWYLALPMKIFYLLIALAAVFASVRYLLYRNNRLHRRELARISQNKEKEVFQAKLEFFTIVAHEIRTPLSLITGPLERIMKQENALPQTVRDNLNVINRNSQRLLVLVNQLLDFKKVEQKGVVVNFEPVNISLLMTSVAERFEPSLSQQGIRLTVDYPPENFTAEIDAEAVTKLLSNLLNNARKFTSSQVTLSCTPGTDTFCLSVSDNGVGISRENINKIFSPFFQVTDRQSNHSGGTGLGLSIVKSVVEAHGGTVTVDSNLGHGSTFTATLPVVQPNRKTAKPDTSADTQTGTAPFLQHHAANGTNRPVMLIVDDNEEMLHFIAGNFDMSYDVVTATDGRDALDKLQNYDVSIIVSDWMMPVMDGAQLCDAVRRDSRYSHIPFIMLTAKTDNFSKIEGFRCGADAYIEKPFSVEYLETRIRNLVEMRELLRQKFSATPLEPITTLATNPAEDKFLSQLNEIIENNLSNPDLSVDFIASHMGISRSGLYSKIKALADVTPNELIQITRLKKAARLLAENRHRVSEICYMVGFNSPSYFAKCFQKQFGMKPAEFAMSSGSTRND